MTIRIPRHVRTPEETVRQYLRLREQSEILDERIDEYKAALKAMLEAQGYADDKGSVWIDLNTEIEGNQHVKHEKRISKILDTPAAEALLQRKQLLDRCTKMVPVLDEDEMMACYAEGLLTEADIDSVTSTKVIWALKVVK